MDNKVLENVFQIPITFEPGENAIDFQINSQQYKQYIAVNPKVTTFMSWVNISEKIGNNKINFSSGEILDSTNEAQVIYAKTYKTSNVYSNSLNQFIYAFNQGDQIDPSTNCLLDRNLLIDQFNNFILINNTLDGYNFFSSYNFENGAFDTSNGNPIPGASNRIRSKSLYKLNGNIILQFNRTNDFEPCDFVYYIYNPNGSFNSGLSQVVWQPFGTTSSPMAPLNVNIPYNQGYFIRFGIRTTNSLLYINPNFLDNSKLTISFRDNSTAARRIVSEPIPILMNPFQINISIPTTLSYSIYCYDENGDFISNPITITTTSIVNIPNTKYVVLKGIYSSLGPITNSPSLFASDQNKITSISYFIDQPAINKTIIIPDGYYSGLVSTPEQTGFMFIVDLINNDPDFQSVGGILSVNSLTFQTKFEGNCIINFIKGGTESSNRLFGFYDIDSIFVNGSPIISPEAIDLFSDGRFSAINIIFTSLASYGYTNETTSLISIPAINGYGKLIRENDISYLKLLPKTSVLSTLSFRLVDNFGIPIELNDRLYLRFEIRAYN